MRKIARKRIVSYVGQASRHAAIARAPARGTSFPNPAGREAVRQDIADTFQRCGKGHFRKFDAFSFFLATGRVKGGLPSLVVFMKAKDKVVSIGKLVINLQSRPYPFKN